MWELCGKYLEVYTDCKAKYLYKLENSMLVKFFILRSLSTVLQFESRYLTLLKQN